MTIQASENRQRMGAAEQHMDHDDLGPHRAHRPPKPRDKALTMMPNSTKATAPESDHARQHQGLKE